MSPTATTQGAIRGLIIALVSNVYFVIPPRHLGVMNVGRQTYIPKEPLITMQPGVPFLVLEAFWRSSDRYPLSVKDQR